MRASSQRNDMLAAAFDQTVMPSPIAIAAIDHDRDAILPGKGNVARILAQPDAECLQMALLRSVQSAMAARARSRAGNSISQRRSSALQ